MTNPETEFTATLAERTIVVSWPDNERGGAVLPPDNWQERAWEERTLHEIDEGSISGCSVLRWRDDPRTDAELLAVSLALVTGKPAAVSVPPPAPQAAARRERYAAAIAEGFAAFDADTTSDAYLDAELLDAVVAVADAEEAELLAAVPVVPPAPRADDQAALRDRIAERPERYAVAIHDAMESDLSLVDQEPGQQALFARAAEAVMALADSEQATLRRKLAAAEKIRENADFHLGQEMARRQLAEKEAARLSADQAAVLNAAAQHLYTALFPAVYDDMGQKAAEGVNRAVSELRRLAAASGPCVAGEQQNETPEAETPTTTKAAASPSVVDEVVAALQAKAQALSVEAEEEMRRDLEDQAQVWHEAADLARRTGRKAVRNAQPTAKPETDGEGAATRFNWSDIIPAPVDETAQERDRLIDCVNRVRVALNDCKERAATGMQYEIAVREAIGDREPRRGPGPLCHESDPRTLRECALKANHGGDHEDGDLAWPRQEHQPAAPADCNTGPAAGVRQDGATS